MEGVIDMYRDFEKVLAIHCAPLLFYKKPAVLLSEKGLPEDCPWEQLHEQGFHLLRLRRRDSSRLCFLYHPQLLEVALSHPLTVNTLKAIGYPADDERDANLSYLDRRFTTSEEFPHEVGFFLGYPPEDVVGFMTCKCKCKARGHWKVYSDAERAEELFEEYSRCSKVLLTHLENGGSILDTGRLAPAS